MGWIGDLKADVISLVWLWSGSRTINRFTHKNRLVFSAVCFVKFDENLEFFTLAFYRKVNLSVSLF